MCSLKKFPGSEPLSASCGSVSLMNFVKAESGFLTGAFVLGEAADCTSSKVRLTSMPGNSSTTCPAISPGTAEIYSRRTNAPGAIVTALVSAGPDVNTPSNVPCGEINFLLISGGNVHEMSLLEAL